MTNVKRIDPRPKPDIVAKTQAAVREFCDGYRISRDDAMDLLRRIGVPVPTPKPVFTKAQWQANRRERELCPCDYCWSLHAT